MRNLNVLEGEGGVGGRRLESGRWKSFDHGAAARAWIGEMYVRLRRVLGADLAQVKS